MSRLVWSCAVLGRLTRRGKAPAVPRHEGKRGKRVVHKTVPLGRVAFACRVSCFADDPAFPALTAIDYPTPQMWVNPWYGGRGLWYDLRRRLDACG